MFLLEHIKSNKLCKTEKILTILIIILQQQQKVSTIFIKLPKNTHSKVGKLEQVNTTE